MLYANPATSNVKPQKIEPRPSHPQFQSSHEYFFALNSRIFSSGTSIKGPTHRVFWTNLNLEQPMETGDPERVECGPNL